MEAEYLRTLAAQGCGGVRLVVQDVRCDDGIVQCTVMSEKVERFIGAIGQAMVVNKLSQRGLATRCGVTIGAITKYLRGEVEPDNVSFGVQRRLAEALGVTIDSLWNYYETGEYHSAVTVRDIESWLRSEAGQEDLPVLMSSLQEAGTRWLKERGEGGQCNESAAGVATRAEVTVQRYTWPREELAAAAVSERMLERLGLTEEVLDALEAGVYDDDVVEAFSVACNYEESAVREAFEGRRPVTE